MKAPPLPPRKGDSSNQISGFISKGPGKNISKGRNSGFISFFCRLPVMVLVLGVHNSFNRC